LCGSKPWVREELESEVGDVWTYTLTYLGSGSSSSSSSSSSRGRRREERIV